jgi:hypothetical protein|eukprot:COSAG01_NODE_39071_length_481_cov_1.178010_1_plen_137_part_00
MQRLFQLLPWPGQILRNAGWATDDDPRGNALESYAAIPERHVSTSPPSLPGSLLLGLVWLSCVALAQGLSLRIATRSCVRATGSLPLNRCKMMRERAQQRAECGANLRNIHYFVPIDSVCLRNCVTVNSDCHGSKA